MGGTRLNGHPFLSYGYLFRLGNRWLSIIVGSATILAVAEVHRAIITASDICLTFDASGFNNSHEANHKIFPP